MNEILKSLEKPCVFEGQDDGLRCGRIAQPRATWGGDGWELPDAKNVEITVLFERKREKS